VAPTTATGHLSLHDALPISAGGRTPVAPPGVVAHGGDDGCRGGAGEGGRRGAVRLCGHVAGARHGRVRDVGGRGACGRGAAAGGDRKSTRLNSSHVKISYAV